VSQFREMKDKTKAIFEAFADLHITSKEAETIYRAAFPEPEVPAKIRLLKNQLSETEAETFKRALTPDLLIGLEKAEEKFARDKETVEKLIATCREREEAFEPARLRGTAWSAFNAVTEIADWREGRNADESALLGSRSREKARVYSAAMVLVKA
jgi:hypothetical protein